MSTTTTHDDETAITIRHTPADGTLVDGTERGDGSASILKAHGYRWFRTLGMWGIPNSRDRQPQHHKITAAVNALRAAGLAARAEVDTGHRDAAEAEADRMARAAARVDALDAKAERKTAAADAAWGRHSDAMDLLPPFGQPILVGHHSERRHRNQIERAHNATRKAIAATDDAREVARRADAAATTITHRYNPVTVKNRIDRLSAEQRKDRRALDGHSRVVARTADHVYRDEFSPATGEYRQRLLERTAQRASEIAHWTGVLEQLQADGLASTYSRENVRPGDLVKYGRNWYRVHRANPKSVSVKLSGEHVGFTNAIGYHKLTGHKPADATD